MAADWTDRGVQRRIINFSAFRLDGLADLLSRSRGVSVFDVGCNRGAVGFDFVLAGASRVHGCDSYEKGIETAREWYADIRSVDARFEVIDLRKGRKAIEEKFPSSEGRYDFMLMLAVYHKLRRVMPLDDLLDLVAYLADRCGKYFVWRGSEQEKDEFGPVLQENGFKIVHYSTLCEVMLPEYPDAVPQPAAVWSR